MKLNRKLTLAFAIVLFSFATILIGSETLFVDKYYMLQKKTTVANAYKESVDYIEENYDGSLENIMFSVLSTGQNTGTIIYLFDVDGNNIINGPTMSIRSLALFQIEDSDGNAVRLDNKDALEENVTEDGIPASFSLFGSRNNESNIGVIGKLKYNDETIGYIIVYSSYTSMKENIMIFNTFTIYVTVVLTLLSIIVSLILSNNLVKPLKEAEAKTRNIANLDFSTKLEVKSKDEIGELSVSINKMSDELESAIKDLQEANKKLEEDLKLKERINKLREEFISDVSHELKTPISIIGGYSEALKLEGLSQEDINDYADIIIDESKRMNKLVRDLLKFTQIESGFINLDREDFSLLDIVNDIIKPNDLRIRERGIELKVDVDDIIINGDMDMLETVFNNFFSNAMNHVEGDMKIWVYTEMVGDKVRVNVRNTGKNISEENMNRIWESFYKIDKARSRQYGGSGLGLAIVKSVMTAYKNKYGVINNEDGVTFYFECNTNNIVEAKEENYE